MLQANALDTTDPLEPMNRVILQGNLLIYQGFERPIAGAYKLVVPAVVRDRIAAGVNNLDEPRIFVNNILQGRPQAAVTTFGRFVLNSTLGVGGLFDLASANGLPRQTGDFGQTLYVWGLASGPYIVMPILGPATFRDGFGKAVDPELNASSYVIWHYGGIWPTVAIGGFGALDNAGGLDDVLAGSLDLYPRLRSIYLQKRSAELGEAVGITINPQTEPMPITPGLATPARPQAAKAVPNQAVQQK